MSNQRIEQPTTDTMRVKSVDAIQATNSGHRSEPLHLTTSATGNKHSPSTRLIALLLLVGIGAVVYFMRRVPASTLREEFEALAAVICVLACGGLLIRRVSRVLALEKEDQIEPPVVKKPIVPLSEVNRAELQIFLNTPPPGAGQNVNNKTENL